MAVIICHGKVVRWVRLTEEMVAPVPIVRNDWQALDAPMATDRSKARGDVLSESGGTPIPCVEDFCRCFMDLMLQKPDVKAIPQAWQNGTAKPPRRSTLARPPKFNLRRILPPTPPPPVRLAKPPTPPPPPSRVAASNAGDRKRRSSAAVARSAKRMRRHERMASDA